jgi:hypothetical protein
MCSSNTRLRLIVLQSPGPELCLRFLVEAIKMFLTFGCSRMVFDMWRKTQAKLG